jgi:hypothetical protein
MPTAGVPHRPSMVALIFDKRKLSSFEIDFVDVGPAQTPRVAAKTWTRVRVQPGNALPGRGVRDDLASRASPRRHVSYNFHRVRLADIVVAIARRSSAREPQHCETKTTASEAPSWRSCCQSSSRQSLLPTSSNNHELNTQLYSFARQDPW